MCKHNNNNDYYYHYHNIFINTYIMKSEPKIELSPDVSDKIEQTTCYMCACRCGR